MTDFKIRKGLSTDLFIAGDFKNGIVDGVVLEKGSWYLCTDTAKLFFCTQTDDGLVLKSINDDNIDALKHEIINTVKPSVDELHTTVQKVILPKVETVEDLRTWIENKEYLQDIDIKGFATEEFVTSKIAEAVLADKDIDLTAYYTKSEVDAKIPSLEGYAKTEDIPTDYLRASDLEGYSKFSGSYNDLVDKPEIPSIEGLATEEFVENKIAEIELPMLEGYATEDFVTEAIDNIQFPEVNLDNYYTKDEVNTEIAAIDIPSIEGLASEQFVIDKINEISIPSTEGFATEAYVAEKITEIEIPDVSNFATKDDIPSIEGLATETFVHEMIAKAELDDKDVDLDAYYTKEQVDATFAVKAEIPSVEGLASEDFVIEKIAEIAIPSTDGFATEQFVAEQIAAVEIPSIEGLASEQFVKDSIKAIPETDLSNYYNKSETEDLVNKAVNGIEVPDVDGFITIEDVEAQGYLVAEDISGKADKKHVHSIADIPDYVDPDIKLKAYYTKAEADLRYITEEELSAKGYITNVDNKADIQHTHDEYLTEQDISGKANIDHKHDDLYDVKGAAEAAARAVKDELLNGASSAYDTLKELGDLISNNDDAIKSLESIAADKADKNHIHTDYAASNHTHDQYLTEQNLSGYAKVDDIPTDYLTAADLKGYSKFSGSYNDLTDTPEIPSVEGLASEEYVDSKISEINIPVLDGFATEEFVTQAITALDIPSIDGLASEQFVTDRIAEITIPSTDGFVTEDYVAEKIAEIKIPDVTDFVTRDEVPSIEGLATEDFVKDEIDKIVIPEAADFSNYYNKAEIDTKFENIEHPTVSLEGYATETWVGEQGFITNVDNKADINHAHEEYLTSEDLAGYSKFSGSYNDLTDKPEIPSLVGYALKSEVALKADAVPFTSTNLVTKPMGSFAVGDDVAGLTLTQILAKLLGLNGSAENPDTPDVPAEPDSIIDTILINKTPLYQINENDEIVEVPYIETLQYNASSVATTKDGKTGFYTVLDATGNVEEAGYQHFTTKKDPWYIVALPEDFNVAPDGNVELQTWNGIENRWTAARYVLTGNYDEIVAAYNDAGITPPVAPDGYRLWADLSDSDPGTSYRFIIKE